MHFYQNVLALLALGTTMAMAQMRGGTCSSTTQLCTLSVEGPTNSPVILTCPRHSPCTSTGSGCTGTAYDTVADQCT